MIRHQVGLLRFSAGLGRRLNELLDATEADLRSQVRIKMRGRAGLRSPAQVQRMERLLAEIREIRARAFDEVEAAMVDEMRALVAAEPRFVDGILRTVLPVSITTTLPDASRLAALVRTMPFQGQNIREHVRHIRAADLRRLEIQVRIGLVQGESLPAIARRLVGTVALRGRNGVTEITRKQAVSLARTAVSAFANAATREWAISNAEIVDRDLFVATLDSRTTPICRALDGETFPIDQVYPQLPLHFGERSRRIPFVDAEAVGMRPMNPTTERGLLREYSELQGIAAPATRDGLPRGQKGKFDQFARARVRELIGRVPAKTSYQEWLGRQSAAFQDDILGPTRGRLFRRGGLTLDRFVDARGLEKSLEQLAIDEAAAFRAIGLDPEDFLARAS